MTLQDLQTKLQARVQKSCGATIDPATLSPYLEHARGEFAKYLPKWVVYTFTLPENQDVVSIEDSNGDPVDVIAADGVWLQDTALGDPNGPITPNTYYDLTEYSYLAFEGTILPYFGTNPSAIMIDRAYRDAFQRALRPVEWYRNHHQFVIQRPASALNALTGAIVYATQPDWGSISSVYERPILDRALAEYIDDALIQGRAGLVRIPSPIGRGFQFDGGKALLALSDRLIQNFEDKLEAPTDMVTQG